jgi:hypothetical protein
LTRDNILTQSVFSNVDTWPYLPAGTIGQQGASKQKTDAIWKEYQRGLSSISTIMDEFIGRQRAIVSWIFAAAIGVVGNLIVNLFFGAIILQFSILWIALIIIAFIALFTLVMAIFFYYPTDCVFRTTYFPPPPDFSIQSYPLQLSKLNSKARIMASFPSSLENLIRGYTGLISLTILRDELVKSGIENMQVTELRRIAVLPFYHLTFGLKHRHLFWRPGIDKKIVADLLKINQALMDARLTSSVYAVDQDYSRWKSRGYEFLNQIASWDLKEVVKEIENQILSL